MVTEFLPEFVAAAFVIVTLGAETLHLFRVQKLALLVFGPSGRPAFWARLAPALRVLAVGVLAWGLTTLLVVPPKTHNSQQVETAKQRHVVILLDVSPSMRLRDAGPESEQSRMQRARVVLESFFDRVPIRQYRLSVIAFYNDAIPVVIDTNDLEVVRNTLNDLPMHYAFKGKDTNLFKGLEKVAEISRSWQPKSTVLMVVSDGDTVPATGMPKLPASIYDMLVVGVGDPVTGTFIAGKNSRQDVSTLRQVAARLGGEFHNGNVQHISSSVIAKITADLDKTRWQDLERREYALLAIGIGAGVLALLPLLLNYFGTRWRPGNRVSFRRTAEGVGI
jgi:Ca-activated chloride channel family protein